MVFFAESISERRGARFFAVPLPVLFLISAAILVISGCEKEQKAGPPPPPVVEVTGVMSKDIPVFSEWVGTLDGLVNADDSGPGPGISHQAELPGRRFGPQRPGAVRDRPPGVPGRPRTGPGGSEPIQRGPQSSKAGLSQSKGALEQAKASLEKAKAEVSVQDARWTTAKANLARIKPLAEQNAVSKKDLDDAVGMELSFRSSVDAAKAAVDVAQANIVAAEAQVVGARTSRRLRPRCWPPRPAWRRPS